MNISVARRKYNEVKILEVRSLTTADLALLRQKTPPVNPVKTLRDRHHHMAFLIALGKPNTEIAVECKISPTRISQHKSSPAFQELIAKYSAEIEASRIAAAQEFGAKAARNMALAEGLLTDRLSDPEANVSTRDLNRIATDRMDRFGYPRKTLTDSRSVNLNFASNLEAAIARSRKAAE